MGDETDTPTSTTCNKIPKIMFMNGTWCPVLALGTFEPNGDVDTTKNAVEIAIDAGYRHFDCALIYKNEDQVGQAICNKLKEGVIKRNELFITGKLWNTYHAKDLVKDAYNLSLEQMMLTFMDMYLINWPTAYADCQGLQPKDKNGKIMYANVPFTDTWHAMEILMEKDRVSNIGVCNFSCKQIEKLVNSCRVTPHVHQIECHPYLKQNKLIEYCESRGIVIEAYSPLGSSCDLEYRSTEPILLEDETIKTIAEKHGKSAASVLIRYPIQRGLIAIPKSSCEDHILNNIDIWDFALDKEDMEAIKCISTECRYHCYYWIGDHPDYPFKDAF